MTILAIWLIIWFILNIALISLGIYIKILSNKNYTSFLERWAIKQHERRIKSGRVKLINRMRNRIKK